ncbi:hypothetical protein [Roseateles flavus]|uniref:Uncharacterized protein n=1 Tax=Roseateles flavus TaxID=3149041 RepID=A0ABV0GKG7_9BURK
MGPVELSPVQIANLNMLVLIVECTKHDSAGACSRFCLDADQAEFLCSLAFQQLLSFVTQLGDECLFPPRADLVQVLSWPPQLSGPMLLAHPPDPRVPGRAPDESPGHPSSASTE